MTESNIAKKLELTTKANSYDDMENHGLICTVDEMKYGKHLIKIKIIKNTRGPSVFLDQQDARKLLRWLTDVVEKDVVATWPFPGGIPR